VLTFKPYIGPRTLGRPSARLGATGTLTTRDWFGTASFGVPAGAFVQIGPDIRAAGYNSFQLWAGVLFADPASLTLSIALIDPLLAGSQVGPTFPIAAGIGIGLADIEWGAFNVNPLAAPTLGWVWIAFKIEIENFGDAEALFDRFDLFAFRR